MSVSSCYALKLGFAISVPIVSVAVYYLFKTEKPLESEDVDYDPKTPVKTKLKKYLFRIPRKCIGIVIGKQGTTISRLQMETRCFIRIVQYDPTSALNVDSEFRGNYHKCNESNDESSDEDWIEEKKVSRKMIPYVEIMGKTDVEIEFARGQIQSLLDTSFENKEEEVIEIPREVCGFLVGARGSNLKQVARECGARIVIEDQTYGVEQITQSNLSNKVTVRVFGARRNIDFALTSIDRSISKFEMIQARLNGQKTKLKEYEEPEFEEEISTMRDLKCVLEEEEVW